MNSLIETLNQWGGKLPGFAWPMLWQSSLLIGLLFAGDLLLRRRLRASIRYALWLAVLVKLCLPPTLALPTSPAWWWPQTPPPVMAEPKLPHYSMTYDQGPLPEMPFVPLPVFTPPPPAMTPAAWWLVICASTGFGLLQWLLVRWWQITRLVRRAAASERLMSLADATRRVIGMDGKVPVRLTDQAMSPAVCGLFRPTILIPQALAAEFSDAQLRAVLLHELIHLRRRDVWVNFFQTLLQIGYWWHPLVWLANARIRRVREEAVDDAVMLALRDEAEAYAPTLLEVARLALNRPLATLGLVGILESRSALRQRIERLVDFRAPRQAGLTLVSLLGILAFTAIAVPMGEGPVPPAKSNVLVTAAVQPGSLTMKVNLEILIRNLTAQAGNSWLSPTNDPWEILMEVLRGEGVDCNPPHGLAINHQTGEITTQNTPEQLEIFRQVIDQLNRADGKCALPLRLSSFHRPPVLIDAQCYWLSTTELQQLVSGLPSYGSHTGDAQNWTIAPELREEMNRRIALLGVTPFSRPRIQTSHGIEARLYCGNGTNGLELACRPLVIPGGITMDYRTELVGDPSGKDQTLNGTNRHLSFGFAPVENQGGIMLQEAGLKTMEKHLVMLLNLQVLTNEPAVGESSGILTNANFRQMARALEQRSGVEFLKEPEPQLVSRTGRGINGMTMTNYSVSLSNANPSGSIRPPASVSYEYGLPYHDDLVRDGQLLYEMGQLAEAEVKFKAALTADSNNGTAKYYLGLMKTNWVVPKAITYTGSGRQEIVKRLHEIRLDHVEYDGVHLADVLRDLSQQTRTNDPEKKGLNFVINPNPDKTGLIDPATGLPVAQTTEASSTEAVGLGSFVIKIPRLNDVRLGDVLDAVVKGASEPIRYSIQDFAVVFSAGKPLPPLYARTFTVDTNSFLTALRKVTRMQTNSVPALARSYFSTLGVNWESPAGKAIFYSDSRGQLYVKATVSDLDKIEHAISDQLPPTPQIHIKARFVAVIQEDSKTAGFDWYLGQFNANNAVVGVGGSSSPPAVAVSASNPRGIFPGNTNSGPDGLHNSAPAITSLTGILAATNSRVVIHALEQRGKSEVLGEPEVTTASGRRTIMKATTTISVITNFTYQETATNSGIIPQFENAEFGPVLDSTASVLSDGYTIDLNIQASYSEFLGYYKTTNTTAFYTKNGKKVNVPSSFPRIEVRQTSTHMKVPDGQTVVLGGMIIPSIRTTKDKVPLLGNLPVVGRLFQSQSKTEIKKNLMIFVTATIVDPAGNRVHSDDDLPFAQKGVPPQPAQFNNGNSNGH